MNTSPQCPIRLRSLAVVVALLSVCTAAFGSDAVAYQIDPAHTGSQSDGPLPPLARRWSRDLGGPISYPLIAEGKVFVIVASPPEWGTKLYALDEETGATVSGPVDNFGMFYFAGHAYEGGRRKDLIEFGYGQHAGVAEWQTLRT